jgi:hypothetical protein
MVLRWPATADEAAGAAASRFGKFELIGDVLSDSLDALHRTFAALCAKYQVTLPATVAKFENLWRRIIAAEAPASQLADLIQIVHNISGNAKTFGFGTAGEVAREIELCLAPPCVAARLPDAAEQARVAALLAALKSAAK